MKYKRHNVLILIILVITIQACGTAVIKMDQIPRLEGGSPLSSIEPVTFIIKAESRTGKYVGLGVAPGGRHAELDRKVSDVVAEAIGMELKRNGHRVLESSDINKADLVIIGIVLRYWVEPPKSFLVPTHVGTAQTHITILKAKDSVEMLSKTYEGVYHRKEQFLKLPGVAYFKDVLDNALLNMVKDFTTDPEFLDCLQKIRRVEK